jgi:hypothetical protein
MEHETGTKGAGSREEMKLEQTLHGYSGGHRLLASSRPLPAKAKRTLAVMSDLSGSGSEKGYRTYLTGYPLPGIKEFAFARTWYATEMSRPGCVWTHTLLVSFSDLAHLNPLWLNHLFERPSPEAKQREFYSQTRRFSSDEVPSPVQNEQVRTGRNQESARSSEGLNNPGRVAKALIGSLYGESATRPVLVVSRSSGALDETVLRVWNQQWPGLKRKFTFCTGSLSSREVNGEPVDLQVIPSSRRRAFEGASNAFRVVSPFESDVQDKSHGLKKQWIEVAVEDLQSPSDFALRKHLRSFGADVDNGRAAFKPLTESFIASQKGKNSGERQASFINLLGENFPQRVEAGKLKKEALGRKPSLFPDATWQDEKTVLCELASTDLQEAFDYDSLEIDERVREACSKGDRIADDILRCLLKEKLNPQGQRMLEVAIGAIGVDDLARLAGKVEEKLWPTVLEREPSVATKSRFWKEVRERTEVCIEVLSDVLGSDREAWGNVVAAAIVAGVDDVAESLAAHLDFAASAFMDGLEKVGAGRRVDLSYKWKRLVKKDLPAIEAWVADHENLETHTALFLIDLWSPRRIDTQNTGLKAWENVIEKAQGSDFKGQTEEFLTLMAFVLSLGFRSEKGSKLAAGSFPYIHHAVAQDQLAERSWRWINRSLPTSRRSWKDIFSWDRCEKLRRGLIHCWAKREWPLTDLLEAAGNADTLRKVLDSMKQTRRGRRLLRELEQSLSDGKIGGENVVSVDTLKDLWQ